MQKQSVQKLTVSAVFAALILVSTMFLSIKLPNGYANLGDGFVIVGALLLGKYYGACAAAIGSGLADLFEGYALYAPATIIIKALMALIAALIFEAFKDKDKIKIKFSALILASLVAEIIMVFGYFLYETILYGAGTAALSVVGNAMQGLIGIVAAFILYNCLSKIKIF